MGARWQEVLGAVVRRGGSMAVRQFALAALVALTVGACGMGRWFGGAMPDGTVSGTVTCRERIALPPDATLVVTLEDVSRAEAPVLIAEQTIETRGRQPPFAFELRYKGEAINPQRVYQVSAQVLFRDRAMLIPDPTQLVLTRGRRSSNVEIQLKRADGS
jgi:putative lipoprotein